MSKSLAKRPADAPPVALVEEVRRSTAEVLMAFDEGRIAEARAAWERIGRALRYGPALKARGVPRYVTHDLGDGRGERTMTVSAWARELGRTSQALTYRLERMSLHKALVPRAADMSPVERPEAPAARRYRTA